MENTKRTIILLICVIFAFSPLMTLGSFSYAEDTPSGGGGYAWSNISTEEELVAAFKAYCKSRNFDISHVPNSVKAIVNWDYNELQKMATIANIDLTLLNAEIWYRIDQNDHLRFFFESPACRKLNQLYNAIINQNDIAENTSEKIYSGKYFADSDGFSCYVFICNETYVNTLDSSVFQSKVKYGTAYRWLGYPYWQQHSSGNYEQYIHYENNTVSLNLRVNNNYAPNTNYNNLVEMSTSAINGNSFSNSNSIYLENDLYSFIEGYGCIIYNSNTNKYYVGCYMKAEYLSNGSPSGILYNLRRKVELPYATANNSEINYNQGDENEPQNDKSLEVETDDDTINNYITNNNTTNNYYYYDTDDTPQPPNYTNPFDDNPTGGVINPDGSINFQMPDLNIDWHLNLNTNNLPFPFSIPYDMINFFNAFSAEPVTPHIQENVTIANMTIPIDIDLSWLDDTAGYFRTFLLLSYVFGLIIATRALFHIY